MRNSRRQLFITTIVMMTICVMMSISIGFTYAYFADQSSHTGAGNVAILEIDILNPATGSAPTRAHLTYTPPSPYTAQTYSNGTNQLITLSTAGNTIAGYLKATVYVKWYESTNNTEDGYMFDGNPLAPTVTFTFGVNTAQTGVQGYWRRLSTSTSLFDEYYFCVYADPAIAPVGQADALVAVPPNVTINFLTSATTAANLPSTYTDGKHYFVIHVEAEIEQIV